MTRTRMEMTYEYISPEKAAELLEKNSNNRRISVGVVRAYKNDIVAGNWDESVGTAISIDENGILRDGQHRLAAIVEAGIGIKTWVCRNVSETGMYDNNRPRSNSDQISILRPDFEAVYNSSRYISVARVIITRGDRNRRKVTPKELIDFTEKHKEDLDAFFLAMPQGSVAKISLATVYLSLFLAYKGGVKITDITNFYEILCSGMSTAPEEFPIIAYRNYLKDVVRVDAVDDEIGRCQYALKKYLTSSCTKRSIVPKALIWPFPYKDED